VRGGYAPGVVCGTQAVPRKKENNSMSQAAVGPRKQIERQIWTELTPQALYDKCLTLANNLWWSWHPEVVNLFRDLDPIKWRKVDHNPIVLLAEMTPDQLAERAAEMVLYTRINQAHRRLKEYLSNSRTTWGARETGVLGSKPVAYFSAEFGLHESVPIYSGGLGVLSGDHVKSASSLGIPLVALGLFYDQGYFKQQLDQYGYQQEEYQDTRVENLPIEPAIGTDGKQVTVSIETRPKWQRQTCR
jgi:starch phosphorylase